MFKVINKDTSTTPMALYSTAWKVSKYEVFAGPYSVRMQENTDQKRLRIGIFFTRCSLYFHYVSFIFLMLPYFFIHPYALYSLYFHWHDNVKKTAITEVRHFHNSIAWIIFCEIHITCIFIIGVTKRFEAPSKVGHCFII